MTFRTTYSDSLTRLLKGICKVPSALDTYISGLATDSRQVRKGDLFLALSGSRSNATDHIKEAIKNGANAVVAEGNLNNGKVFEDGLAVELFVDGLKAKVGLIADRFYRSPSRDLSVIGVTGTNGKTSVTHYLAQYFSSEMHLSGVIGTLGYGLISETFSSLKETGFTTPDSVAVHRLLAELRDAGAENVFMEVSSHGLSQGRVDAVRFEGAVFTNLTRDHLDYHGTMEDYAQSKRKLFQMPGLKFAVVNNDDGFSRVMLEGVAPEVQKLSYGIKSKADISVKEYQLGLEADAAINAVVVTPVCGFQIQSPLIGLFNLSNVLAVISVAQAKQALRNCEQRIRKLKPVSGRMQMIHLKNKPSVVIDYAHTADALQNALTALKPHCRGKIILVFGCGGNRDTGKRSEMAAVAEQMADVVIVTDDNPRFESPDLIVRDILSGFKRPENIFVEHDRKLAIQQALQLAGALDLVLIAGKGHEAWQEVKSERKYFSDLEQVQINLGIKASTSQQGAIGLV